MGWNKGPHLILHGSAQSTTGSTLELNLAGPHASLFYTLALQYPSWSRFSGFRIQRRDTCGQIEVKSTPWPLWIQSRFLPFLWVFLCFLHFLRLGNSNITFIISKHKSHNKKLKAHIQNADPNHVPNTVMGMLGLGLWVPVLCSQVLSEAYSPS